MSVIAVFISKRQKKCHKFFEHILLPNVKTFRNAVAILKFQRKDFFIYMTYRIFSKVIFNSRLLRNTLIRTKMYLINFCNIDMSYNRHPLLPKFGISCRD